MREEKKEKVKKSVFYPFFVEIKIFTIFFFIKDYNTDLQKSKCNVFNMKKYKDYFHIKFWVLKF